jgi:hypothetical protein
MLKKSLGLVSGAALICLFAYGCSSSDSTVTPAADAGTSSGGDSGSTTKKDSGGTPDTDGGDETGDTCTADADAVKDFAPNWIPPSGKAQGKCTDAQVEALLSCELDPAADQTACKAVIADKNNKDCGTCLESQTGDAKYGPIIIGDGVVQINYAGCIALLEPDVTADGCGAKYQALGECTDTACQCPVTDDATFADRNKCLTKAETTVCKSFQADAGCDTDLVAAGAPAEACDISGGEFIDNAIVYGKFFCGGAAPVTDSGPADAPSDG